LVWSAAVCLIVVAAVLASAAGWLMRDRAARREKVAGDVRAALKEADTFRQQALPLIDHPYQWHVSLAAARSALQRAEALAGPVEGLDPAVLGEITEGKKQLQADERRYPSGAWIRQAEQLIALDAKLPKLLRGEIQPADAAERLALAWLCQMRKKLYATAARFYAEAFTAQRLLADDLKASHRYNAACAAALAGCGQGEDAATLHNAERAGLRRQALDWLRGDLASYARSIDGGPAEARAFARKQMQHWQRDTALAGVRGAALAKLPEAERRHGASCGRTSSRP
jgi:hypothetical protein